MKLLKWTANLGLTLVAAIALSGCLTGRNTIELHSDAGDYIGQGKSYQYTQADALLTLTASGNRLSVRVDGDDHWTADFQEPNSLTELKVGTYQNLTRYPFHDPAVGGLDWGGEGRGCNMLTGWFAIDKVVYTDGTLSAIDLRFEQHCEGNVPALKGEIHWDANDKTAPPGPRVPAPTSLWQPATGTTPTTGNYVYLNSDSQDYIGQGQTTTMTLADSLITLSASGAHLAIQVNGAQSWRGDFGTMNGLTSIQKGYYGGLQRYGFSNPVKGGLDWNGQGRGCNTLSGWFVVDDVTYQNGILTAIDLRFEQHCEGALAALRGKIHWTANDPTTPPGPVNPPPAGLWQPADGATPTTDNYLYLQSDSGDYVGQGQTHAYSAPNAAIMMAVTNGHLESNVMINGSLEWFGDFQTMNSVTTLQPGYYGNLQRYPFHNPVLGGMLWTAWGGGQPRICNSLQGWVVVDSVSYVNGTLKAIDLRFEQHCNGATPALHGKLHWTS